jgi:lysyl-tRNA synthetase class 1
MHWIDGVAQALLRRGKKYVIASGISISGHVHIGHANDVFIADAIRRSLSEKGVRAQAFWYADDYDPMRRVPWPLNQGELAERYKQYLGFPYKNIPSPDPQFESFVDYFQRPFVDSLGDFGIKIKVYSGAEVYRSGKMAGLTRTALESSDEIRKILNKYRSEPLPEGWLPYDPICGKCGRIVTAKAISWDGNLVKYRCEGTDYVTGCGHEGEADFTKGEGKLTWRVEWSARWKMLGVTCEPFGKDHAVVGGSYDTGKLISKKVFGYEPPHPIPYEWVSLHGQPMSSSHGIVFTLPQWLEVAEPELLRFLIFRSKPMKAKDFDAGLPLLDFYDEYDTMEQVHFKKVKAPPSRAKQISRIYELSQVKGSVKRAPQRISFRFAAVLCQVARGDEEKAVEIMKKRKMLTKPTKSDIGLAMRRLALAGEWIELYAPANLRFSIIEELPPEVKGRLSEKQREGLGQIARDISGREFTAVDLHNHIYSVAEKHGLKPGEMFQAIYLVLLGRTSGPRAGAFISVLEKDFVVSRLQEAAS